jgi:hypothetical protein
MSAAWAGDAEKLVAEAERKMYAATQPHCAHAELSSASRGAAFSPGFSGGCDVPLLVRFQNASDLFQKSLSCKRF